MLQHEGSLKWSVAELGLFAENDEKDRLICDSFPVFEWQLEGIQESWDLLQFRRCETIAVWQMVPDARLPGWELAEHHCL